MKTIEEFNLNTVIDSAKAIIEMAKNVINL